MNFMRVTINYNINRERVMILLKLIVHFLRVTINFKINRERVIILLKLIVHASDDEMIFDPAIFLQEAILH